MAPHLPLPISSGRCGDNGDATSGPVGISPIGDGRWRDWTDKGRIGRRARGRGALRSPFRNLRVARNKRSGRHHGDDDNNEGRGEERSL